MKKQKVQFIILAVVLVVLVGGYFLLRNRPEQDTSGDNIYTALTITTDDVRQITAVAAESDAGDDTDSSTDTDAGTDAAEAEGSDADSTETDTAAAADTAGNFSLTYDGTAWTFGDSDAAVDSDKADSILEALAVISGSEQMEDVDSLADYGLDSPSETITITMENGDAHTLSFGSYNELGDCYYFRVDAENTVYACSSDFYNTFQVSEDDLTQQADESTTGETAQTAATQEPAAEASTAD